MTKMSSFGAPPGGVVLAVKAIRVPSGLKAGWSPPSVPGTGVDGPPAGGDEEDPGAPCRCRSRGRRSGAVRRPRRVPVVARIGRELHQVRSRGLHREDVVAGAAVAGEGEPRAVRRPGRVDVVVRRAARDLAPDAVGVEDRDVARRACRPASSGRRTRRSRRVGRVGDVRRHRGGRGRPGGQRAHADHRAGGDQGAMARVGAGHVVASFPRGPRGDGDRRPSGRVLVPWSTCIRTAGGVPCCRTVRASGPTRRRRASPNAWAAVSLPTWSVEIPAAGRVAVAS